jgi:thioesterase domain-containing protein
LLNWIADLHPEVADARQHPAYGALMGLVERRDVDAMIALCQREALLPMHLDTALVKAMLGVYQAGTKAAEAYDAPPAKTRVTFFAADRNEGEDLSFGWSGVLGDRLEVIRIGGSHRSIVKSPHIEKLAREIARRIRSHSPSSELSFA